MEDIAVGKSYRTRNGQIVTVDDISGGIARFPWIGSDGRPDRTSVWATNRRGLAGKNSAYADPQDFMEEVSLIPEPVQLDLFE